MTKTIAAFFQKAQHASAAATRLEHAGLSSDGIDIWSTPHNQALSWRMRGCRDPMHMPMPRACAAGVRW
jgi:hypothetical protein